MSYQATETHGGNLNAYFSVKEASLKRLHVVWFQFYDILEKANYTYKKRSVVKKKKISGGQRCGYGGEGWIVEAQGILLQWNYSMIL